MREVFTGKHNAALAQMARLPLLQELGLTGFAVQNQGGFYKVTFSLHGFEIQN